MTELMKFSNLCASVMQTSYDYENQSRGVEPETERKQSI